jgi:ferredoxin-NADP reductase
LISPSHLDLLVVERRDEATEAVSFVFAHPNGGPLPSWTPGAHVDVVTAPGLVRQYSLSGLPCDRETWRITVLREASGRGGSAYLHSALHVGQSVRVSLPRNNFALVPAKRYVFVAGGIGITPLISMIDEVARGSSEWELHYAGRTRDHMAHLEDLGRYSSEVHLYPKDSYGPFPLDTIADIAAEKSDTAVFACGPGGLLDSLKASLDSRPSSTFYSERFRASEGTTGTSEPFEIRLHESGVTLDVPPTKTILEVLEDYGIPMMSSCRSGTCGTCETPVLNGIPDHRDSILTEEERASRELIIPCVSRAHSAFIELDL